MTSRAYRSGLKLGQWLSTGFRVGVVLAALFALLAISLARFLEQPRAWGWAVLAGGSLLVATLLLMLLLAAGRKRQDTGLFLFSAGLAAYALVTIAGALVRRFVERPPEWIWSVVASAAVVALLLAIGSAVKYARRRKELDRLIFTEATSLSFFSTVVAAATYGLLESWVGAPKLSMWFVWLFAMGSWLIAGALVNRRFL